MVIAYAGFILLILVVLIVGEMCDFARTLDGGGCALEAVQGLNGESEGLELFGIWRLKGTMIGLGWRKWRSGWASGKGLGRRRRLWGKVAVTIDFSALSWRGGATAVFV